MAEYRVFGPPGTGKTTYLTQQVENAVERYGTDGVFVTSFTRAGAAEISSRVKLPRSHAGTLHSFCYHALGQPEIAEVHAGEFDRGGWQVTPQSEFLVDADVSDGDAMLAQVNRYRATMTWADEWHPDVKKFYENWVAWKSENDYLDFTDMIELALAERIPPPEGAVVGMFDEAQDFSYMQVLLIRMWIEEYLEYGVIAGDPAQAIYDFVGASPKVMTEPALPPEYERVLQHSHRLPRSIHKFSSAWAERMTEYAPKAFAPRDEEGECEQTALGIHEPRSIARVCLDAAQQGTVMMLTTCSYMLNTILFEMRRMGMLFHNPYRKSRGDWNPLRGKAAEELLMLSAPSTKEHGSNARPWTYKDLREGSKLMLKTGVFRRGATKLLDGPEDSWHVSREILDGLFEPGVEERLLADPVAFALEHVAKPREKILRYIAQIVRKQGWDALNEKPRIIVGTIHSVKGGEADRVLLAPDLSTAGWRNRFDDSFRRQMYVGMTRARQRLDLLAPAPFSQAVGWNF